MAQPKIKGISSRNKSIRHVQLSNSIRELMTTLKVKKKKNWINYHYTGEAQFWEQGVLQAKTEIKNNDEK